MGMQHRVDQTEAYLDKYYIYIILCRFQIIADQERTCSHLAILLYSYDQCAY